MSGNIEKHPVIIIAEIIWSYQKSKCATYVTGKRIPKWVYIRVFATAGYLSTNV